MSTASNQLPGKDNGIFSVMYEKKKDISKGYLIKTNIIQRNELQDIPELKDYKESSAYPLHPSSCCFVGCVHLPPHCNWKSIGYSSNLKPIPIGS
ncbi:MULTISPECIES: hypothetical protein [Photorhabdus]|uniref:hypothetical protein n=1 Tax=Photorhabdus TaxID=29487 RepID=UPI0013914641|nr:hypothetical protein [Photorhabdus asymbiotica]